MDGSAIPRSVLEIIRVIGGAGHTAYLTGGPVRDSFMGRAPRDWDLATSAPAESVARLFPTVNPSALKHDTVGVYHGGLWVEVTTFRDAGRTLEGDLGLRDFTMNAMALDTATGRVIDPLDGANDIGKQIIRGCGRAADRFSEDPLRMLRAGRFVAELGFTPDDGVTRAAAAMGEKLQGCAAERIRDEWLKLMVAPHIREGLAWIEQTGLWKILFPTVEATRGVEQNRFHKWDVYTHTIETVARSEGRPEIRLAAMFHDLGKPATRQHRKGDWTFYGHERVGAEIASAELDRYRFPHVLRDRVSALVAHHMFHYEQDWGDAAVRRFLQRVGPDLVDDLFALRRADKAGSGMGKEPETEENLAALRGRIDSVMARGAVLDVKGLAIDGHAVAGLTGGQGRDVGVILRALLDRVIDNPALNEQDTLLRLASKEVERLASGKRTNG